MYYTLAWSVCLAAAVLPMFLDLGGWQNHLTPMVICNFILIVALVSLIIQRKKVATVFSPLSWSAHILMLLGAPMFLVCAGEKLFDWIQWWSIVCLLFWIPVLIISVVAFRKIAVTEIS